MRYTCFMGSFMRNVGFMSSFMTILICFEIFYEFYEICVCIMSFIMCVCIMSFMRLVFVFVL